MKKISIALVAALSIGSYSTAQAIEAPSSETMWKVAGVGVAAMASYALYKTTIGQNLVQSQEQPAEATTNKSMYCNPNDHKMHIVKKNDHVFKDATGKSVSC